MKNWICIILLVMVVSCTAPVSSKDKVSIVINDKSSKVVKFAAAELSGYLKKLYPKQVFTVVNEAATGKSIFLRVTQKAEGLPDNPEAYVVTSSGNKASIFSKSDKGLVYGVYGLLEKLGCGFYISEETLPAAREEFSFQNWELSDQPLVKKRYVFNWHNFISGCTSWNKKHWFQWIDRSQKMGYNSVMVHAYFNNPMHSYSFKGMEKPSGYISTSGNGREWGNIPVSDVRRLPGGDVFSEPEFGCEDAMVPFENRVSSAQNLMKQVFKNARDRGLAVCFAIDADKSIQYLQKNLIGKIPAQDKFLCCKGEIWFPNSDTVQGMEFYTAQIEGLLKSYPMLNEIACWRRGSSFFKTIGINELPVKWKKELQQYLNDYEVLKKIHKGELMSSFITSKLVRAYRKSLKKLGRSDIKVVTGTWGSRFIVPTAIFLPKTKLMPIDWNIRFAKSLMDSEKTLANIEKYAKGQVIPFLWSHHDDGQYIGRCYKPVAGLYTKLKQIKAAGCGAFHWLNRPQDLYFKNMQRQTWARSADQTFQESCRQMALDFWGDKTLGDYLINWLNEAPIFGRATQPNMHYRPWKECTFESGVREKTEKRLAFLNRVDSKKMNQEQKYRLQYFKLLEQFILEFIDAQRHLDKAEALLKAGDIVKAGRELSQGNPEQAVRTFAQMSNIGNIDQGEKAYIVSLATKWIGDYDSFRQRARILPIKVKFGETVPENVAQSNVNLWYYIDTKGKFWEKLGNEILDEKSWPSLSTAQNNKNNDSKSKKDANTNTANEKITFNKENHSKFAIVKRPTKGGEDFRQDIFNEGIQLTKAIVRIRPIMRAGGVANSSHVTRGKYKLKIFASSPRKGVFEIAVDGKVKTFSVKGDEVLAFDLELEKNAELKAKFSLKTGEVILSGLILQPVEN